MFFEEEENRSLEDFKKEELYGGYSPHNFDVNITFFDALYEKIYSRWKLHFFIFFSLQIIISNSYPIFFMFLYLDILMQYCWLLNVSEYITQESHCDYGLLVSQKKGGDLRLNISVFVYYDALGYVSYGFNNVSHNICNEIYLYKNYMGLQSKIYLKKYKYNHNYIKNKDLKISKYDNQLILNYKNKFNINYKKRLKLRKLVGLNFYSNRLRKNYDRNLNFYLYHNEDFSCNYKNKLLV